MDANFGQAVRTLWPGDADRRLQGFSELAIWIVSGAGIVVLLAWAAFVYI